MSETSPARRYSSSTRSRPVNPLAVKLFMRQQTCCHQYPYLPVDRDYRLYDNFPTALWELMVCSRLGSPLSVEISQRTPILIYFEIGYAVLLPPVAHDRRPHRHLQRDAYSYISMETFEYHGMCAGRLSAWLARPCSRRFVISDLLQMNSCADSDACSLDSEHFLS